jgi:hypothetical protein
VTARDAEVRRTIRRLRGICSRVAPSRLVRVGYRHGTYRVTLDHPLDGRRSHALLLPRYLERAGFEGLPIICVVSL